MHCVLLNLRGITNFKQIKTIKNFFLYYLSEPFGKKKVDS